MDFDFQALEPILEAATPTLLSYVSRIVGVLFALWLAFRIAGWIERRLNRSLKSNQRIDDTLAGFASNLVRWVIIIAAVLSCASVFGIETTSFAAILGAAGLAIGLAFQGTLSNFSSGVMIVTFRPFTVGDFVAAGGQKGTVAEVGLFFTSLDTPDNRRITVPNSSVMGDSIENFSFHSHRRADISVGVAYGSDTKQVREVLESAAASIPGRDTERGHQVILLSMGASSVDWQVRIWCKKEDYWKLWDTATATIKQRLDEAGIEIPFPQMDVHMAPPPAS